MNKTLEQAVNDEIDNCISNNKEFSSHDITVALRSSLDKNKYDVTDCNKVLFNGKPTRFISNDAVKKIVKNTCKRNPDYDKKWVSSNNGGYFVYSNKNNQQTQIVPPQPSTPLVNANDLFDVNDD